MHQHARGSAGGNGDDNPSSHLGRHCGNFGHGIAAISLFLAGEMGFFRYDDIMNSVMSALATYFMQILDEFINCNFFLISYGIAINT